MVLYETRTDASGNTHMMDLTAPDVGFTLDENYREPAYSVTEVEVSAPGFVTAHITNVEIVDTQQSILPVTLVPLSSEPGHTTDSYTDIGPVALLISAPYHKGDELEALAVEEAVAVNSSVYREAPMIEPVGMPGANPVAAQLHPNIRVHNQVFIPDFITVHLGTPSNHAARNVRVAFPQYIKNVTSSEIYSTWPRASLLANIHAIVSFALNRVFTEWYRNRGYHYDITNSTQFDMV
jgi:hypothetical protein